MESMNNVVVKNELIIDDFCLNHEYVLALESCQLTIFLFLLEVVLALIVDISIHSNSRFSAPRRHERRGEKNKEE